MQTLDDVLTESITISSEPTTEVVAIRGLTKGHNVNFNEAKSSTLIWHHISKTAIQRSADHTKMHAVSRRDTNAASTYSTR